MFSKYFLKYWILKTEIHKKYFQLVLKSVELWELSKVQKKLNWIDISSYKDMPNFYFALPPQPKKFNKLYYKDTLSPYKF